MLAFAFLFASVVVLYCLVYFGKPAPTQENKQHVLFSVMLFSGLFLRLILLNSTQPLPQHITQWKSVLERLSATGLFEFYVDGQFGVAPGVLYLLALLNPFLQSIALEDWVRLPAVIADCGVIALVFFVARDSIRVGEMVPISVQGKKRTELVAGLALMPIFLYYIVNPAIIVNGTLIGNFDVIFMLLSGIAIFLLCKQEYIVSAILLGFAALFNPLALIFLIVAIFITIEQSDGDYFKLICTCVLPLVVYLGCIAPFLIRGDALDFFTSLLKMSESVETPLASNNAFNLMSIFWGNGSSPSERFFGLTFDIAGIIFMLGSLVLVGFIYFKSSPCKARAFYCSGLALTLVYTLGPRMEPEYLFPAVMFYILAYVYSNNPKVLLVAMLVALLQFVNISILYIAETTKEFMLEDVMKSNGPAMSLGGMAMVSVAFFAVHTAWRTFVNPKKSEPLAFIEGDSRKMTMLDWKLMMGITLVYAVFAYANLGDNFMAQNYERLDGGKTYTIELAEVKQVSRLQYLKHLGEADVTISYSQDGNTWQELEKQRFAPCFTWKSIDIYKPLKYIRMTILENEPEKLLSDGSQLYINMLEMGIREVAPDLESGPDEAGNTPMLNYFHEPLIMPVSAPANLFDEQDLVPANNDFHSSMYFDEIYHGRTALEHDLLMVPYENTHPPLGKLLILLGIKMFGMNPFGWRIVGTTFGILMLPPMYLFGKRMFGSTFAGAAACFLFAVDFMHFTQTRIATIDTYIVFFIILQYLFMYEYYRTDFSKVPLQKTLVWLFFSGLAFGLGAASKWTGFYSGVGLAIVFLLAFMRAFTEWKGEAMKNTLITLGSCVVFFVLIPFAIYFASFIPTIIPSLGPHQSAMDVFLGYQEHMYKYHTELTETHGYQSAWYEWLLNVRPMWYYTWEAPLVEDTQMNSSITTMGNIFVWWPGLAAIVYSFYLAVRNRVSYAVFFVIAFLAQYLPWVLVPRATFIYHYFTATPFIILALAGFLYALYNNASKLKKITVRGYLTVSGLMFIVFYPAISGLLVSKHYLAAITWFYTWVLGGH